MILWFIVMIHAAVPILSAPQNGNFQEAFNVQALVQPTTQRPFEEKKVDPLFVVANLPSAPFNVTDSAKQCASCGKGPLLACPKDSGEGDCATGEACCYDSCRQRQVCRRKSEIIGFNEKDNNKLQKREADDKISSVVDDKGLKPATARQSEDTPISLDDDYETFNAKSDVSPQSFPGSGSFEGNPNSIRGDQAIFFPFGFIPDNFPQQYDTPLDVQNQYERVPFVQSNGLDAEPPFIFHQSEQPLIPVQQPVIIPQQSYQENYNDDNDDEGGFLDSLFG